MRKTASLGTILPPIMAFGVGAILFAAYLAPFYGAFDREAMGAASTIITEDFDMPEDMPPERLPSGLTTQPENVPLERIEPRAPLSDLGLAAPVVPKTEPAATSEDKAAEGGLFYRPVALAAGRLAVGNHIVELTGIDIVEPEASCADINGEVWACGMQARTAFRSWLRGRAVSCDLEGLDPQQELIRTTCNLAGTDIARWLVENGWARATFGGAYSDSQTQAEKMLLGVFGRAAKKDSGLELPASDYSQ
ncbi:thermonuclease family protein [Pseudochrobactrum sp. MP213Fo]|uniref:thermonuclease family protein n=1 Tax=Pseudochrobactrum sp. MP213Fo TaxID=3022250 RepID=UPI003B9FD489